MCCVWCAWLKLASYSVMLCLISDGEQVRGSQNSCVQNAVSSKLMDNCQYVFNGIAVWFVQGFQSLAGMWTEKCV